MSRSDCSERIGNRTLIRKCVFNTAFGGCGESSPPVYSETGKRRLRLRELEVKLSSEDIPVSSYFGPHPYGYK